MQRAPLIVIAASARGLVESARLAGWATGAGLVSLDAFADFETRAAADAAHRFEDLTLGPTPSDLDAAVALARTGPQSAATTPTFLFGGGLEARWPLLLPACAARGRVVGPSLETVAALADAPARIVFGSLAGFPERLTSGRVPCSGRWYVKPVLRAGGLAVESAEAGARIPTGHYAEEHTSGREVSVAGFVSHDEAPAGTTKARILGAAARVPDSSAWADADGGMGLALRDLRCVHPDGREFGLPPDIAQETAAIARVLGYTGAIGLDLIEDADGRWWLIDINLRPTATMVCLPDFVTCLRAWLATALGISVADGLSAAIGDAAAVDKFEADRWGSGADDPSEGLPWQAIGTLWATASLDLRMPRRFAELVALRAGRAFPDGARAWLTDTPSAPSLFAGRAPVCTVRAAARTEVAARSAVRAFAATVAAQLSRLA